MLLDFLLFKKDREGSINLIIDVLALIPLVPCGTTKIKAIQKEIRKHTRGRKREEIGKILEEFKGLQHIADIRHNRVRKRLVGVRDARGKEVTDRQGIVDTLAEFYEQLFASRSSSSATLQPRSTAQSCAHAGGQ